MPSVSEVRLEHAAARKLAAIRTTASPDRLGPVIMGTLDKIWPLLRGQAARTGHNVVLYYGSTQGLLIIDVGVEVFGDVTADGEVTLTTTPSGQAATIAHFGDYSEMGSAYEALGRWCADNERHKTGVTWEVYGDWDDDPAKRRTDIYFGLSAADGEGSRDRDEDQREPG